MRRVIIFDFDGVLADSLDLFEAAVYAACRDVGFPVVRERAAFLRLFDANFYDGLRANGVPEASLPALVASLRQALQRRAGEYRLFPVIPGVLARLARQAIPFIVTSGIAVVVDDVLRRNGVTCVRRILGVEEGMGKTDKIRAAAAECPGVPYFYVGDTRGDMIEGREAGARTVAAAWGWHAEARLREARPDHVAHTPEDLLRLFGGKEDIEIERSHA